MTSRPQQQAFQHLLQNVFGWTPDTPGWKSLTNDGYSSIIDIITMTSNEIDEMECDGVPVPQEQQIMLQHILLWHDDSVQQKGGKPMLPIDWLLLNATSFATFRHNTLDYVPPKPPPSPNVNFLDGDGAPHATLDDPSLATLSLAPEETFCPVAAQDGTTTVHASLDEPPFVPLSRAPFETFDSVAAPSGTTTVRALLDSYCSVSGDAPAETIDAANDPPAAVLANGMAAPMKTAPAPMSENNVEPIDCAMPPGANNDMIVPVLPPPGDHAFVPVNESLCVPPADVPSYALDLPVSLTADGERMNAVPMTNMQTVEYQPVPMAATTNANMPHANMPTNVPAGDDSNNGSTCDGNRPTTMPMPNNANDGTMHRTMANMTLPMPTLQMPLPMPTNNMPMPANNNTTNDADDGEPYFTFLRLANHRKNNRKWEVLVDWTDGSSSWQPLSAIAQDDPVTCALYARANNLLSTYGWKRFQHYFPINNADKINNKKENAMPTCPTNTNDALANTKLPDGLNNDAFLFVISVLGLQMLLFLNDANQCLYAASIIGMKMWNAQQFLMMNDANCLYCGNNKPVMNVLMPMPQFSFWNWTANDDKCRDLTHAMIDPDLPMMNSVNVSAY